MKVKLSLEVMYFDAEFIIVCPGTAKLRRRAVAKKRAGIFSRAYHFPRVLPSTNR